MTNKKLIVIFAFVFELANIVLKVLTHFKNKNGHA